MLGSFIKAAGALTAVAVGMISGLALEISIVSSNSMAPTLKPGQHLVVWRVGRNRLNFLGPQIRRGDVVTLRLPGENAVKRAVAFGGDHVRIHNGTLYVDDNAVKEPYAVHDRRVTAGESWPVSWDSSGSENAMLPPETVFVLGDNRSFSGDSRYWGAIPVSDVIGKVVFTW
jgi:signal peptidase I